jgi:hypothetical protein
MILKNGKKTLILDHYFRWVSKAVIFMYHAYYYAHGLQFCCFLLPQKRKREKKVR